MKPEPASQWSRCVLKTITRKDGLGLLQREPLHEAVTRIIREKIVKGDLPPGARLQENTLSEMLGVSRTPLREALRALSSEGLIRVLPNKGAIVYQMSVEEVLQTFQVISALDALAGRLAVEHLLPADLDIFEDLHERLHQRFEANDLFGYFKVNQSIHLEILRLCGNVILERQLRSLNATVQPFRFSVNLQKESWERSLRDHDLIMDALRERDGDALAKVLLQHLPQKSDIVRHAFAVASSARLKAPAKRRKPQAAKVRAEGLTE